MIRDAILARTVIPSLLMATILLLATIPAAADPPQPLPPYDLPGDLGSFPAAGNQSGPAIARGGDMYLVAWTDDRTSLFDGSGESGSAKDIYAARLDTDGNLIDTTPIVIDQGEHDQYDPVVVWNGSQWLVLFTDTVPYGPLYTHNMVAVRVDPDGTVVDPDPFMVWEGGTTRGTSDEHLVGAASDGTDWALVIVDRYMQGFSTRSRLVGRRITPAGSIVNAPYYLFSPSCCYFFHKGGLAYADGVYMAVFEGYVSGSEYGIFGLRMSTNLSTLDSYPLELITIPMLGETHYVRTPNIAANDDLFYVGWQLYIDDTSSQIQGARITPDGQSLDGNGVSISAPGPLTLFLAPSLAWDGMQWIAGWDLGGHHLARISAEGDVLDPGGVMQSVSCTDFAGAGTGGGQFVWCEERVTDDMPLDVYSARVSNGLDFGEDACIALGAPSQTQGDLAVGAGGQMIVFRSAISGERRVLAHPLDAGGNAPLAEPVELAAGDVGAPQVAFDGELYLAVWHDADAGTIVGRRLAQDGSLLGDPFVVTTGGSPDAGGHVGEFVVTANQAGSAVAVRITGDGTIVDTTPLDLQTNVIGAPRVARFDSYWLIAYEWAGSSDGSDIEAALITAAGDVYGQLMVTPTNDGIAAHNPAAAAMATGEAAMIMWQDARVEEDDLNLYAQRIAPVFQLLDPPGGVAVATAADHQTGAAVAWDGVRFLTAFTDGRNAVNSIDVRTDVYRNWVPTLGPVESEDGLVLFDGGVPEIDAAVAGFGGEALYTASVFNDVAPHAAYRIALRLAALPSAVDDRPTDAIQLTRLLAPVPNPANPAVRIRFVLAQGGTAVVDVFDVRGRKMRTLEAADLQVGPNEVLWNGTDDHGQPVPSGTYLYRLRSGGVEDVGKVVLVQ